MTPHVRSMTQKMVKIGMISQIKGGCITPCAGKGKQSQLLLALGTSLGQFFTCQPHQYFDWPCFLKHSFASVSAAQGSVSNYAFQMGPFSITV